MKTILKGVCCISIVLLGVMMPVEQTASQAFASVLPADTTSSGSSSDNDDDALSKVTDTNISAISSSNAMTDSSSVPSSVKTNESSTITSKAKLTKAATTDDASTIATGVNGTVTWSIDSAGTLHLSGGAFQQANAGKSTSLWANASVDSALGGDYAADITTISIEGTIEATTTTDYSYLFSQLTNVTSITGLSNLKMNAVTNTRGMFSSDKSLGAVDFGQTDFSAVTDMSSMFYLCTSLTSVVVTDWQLNSLTTMSGMFMLCSSLKTLDTTNWTLSSVTNMGSAFYGCTVLNTLVTNNWRPSGVVNVSTMFYNCAALAELDFGDWTVNNVVQTFLGCSSLAHLNVANWDTSRITSLNGTFSKCSSLATLNIADWQTSQVTNLEYTFMNCAKLGSLTLDGATWDTGKVTDMYGTFLGCAALSSLAVGSWNTSNVTDMRVMLDGCTKLPSLDVKSWKVGKVTSFDNMFKDCINLASLDVSNWDVTGTVSLGYLFSGCTSLVSLDFTNWDTSNATSYANMLYQDRSLQHLTLGKNFTFHNSATMALASPSTIAPYTGKWQLGTTGPTYTANDLMTTYDGSTMAGTYNWEKQAGPITVKYVDGDGVSIADDTTKTGSVGDDYTTTPKTITGYTLSQTPDNATGKFTAVAQTVTYVYTGQLLFTSVPKTLDFGSHALENTAQTYGATLAQSLSVQDNRQLNSSWQLSAQLGSDGFVGTKTGKKLAATLYYQNGNTTSTIDSTTGTLITSHTTVDHQPVSVSGAWDGQTTGLFLEVPAGVADLGTYEGTVTWNLGNTVKNN